MGLNGLLEKCKHWNIIKGQIIYLILEYQKENKTEWTNKDRQILAKNLEYEIRMILYKFKDFKNL